MNPINNHLRSTLGIDLDRPSLDYFPASFRLPRDASVNTLKGRQVIEHYLTCVYDCVVGGTALESFGTRISTANLEKLITAAQRLRHRTPNLSDMLILDEVIAASKTYIRFLNGDINTPAITKTGPVPGCRHTLLRANGGRIYEMLNSMSEPEINQFRNKSRMILPAVENAKSIVKGGETYKKIELGKGGYGKARIARDIDRDQFVAVKKMHPALIWMEPTAQLELKRPIKSVIGQLTNAQKIALTRILDSVILPEHETEYRSRPAEIIEKEIGELIDAIMRCDHPQIIRYLAEKKIVDPTDHERILKLLNSATLGAIATSTPKPRSVYNFSELGVASVGTVAESFNFIRYCFESVTRKEDLCVEAKSLLIRYSEKVNKPDSHLTAAEVEAFHFNAALAKFENEDFKLKDTVFNHRFLNTLGKKMIEAIDALHEKGFGHGDIKPDNIVLCQSPSGNVAVKLIDLDMLRPMAVDRKLPKAGTPDYEPPESAIVFSDGSIAYQEDLADSFAMGISLREILGFSSTEVEILSAFQKMDKTRRKMFCGAAGFAGSVNRDYLRHQNRGQNLTRIAAKMRTAPEFVSLKDISDLMIKADVGKRKTAAEVLKLDFFNRNENFLSDHEFSSHALFTVALGSLVPRNQLAELNGVGLAATRQMRKIRLNSDLKVLDHNLETVVASGRYASPTMLDQAFKQQEANLKTTEKLRYMHIEVPKLLTEFRRRGMRSLADWALVDKRPGLLK